MRGLAAVALMATLSACSTPPAPAPTPVAIAAKRAPTVAAALDTCGAAELQHLVGRPRTEVPVPIRPEHHRVTCATCPVATDADETRLNFIFDGATGLISAVRCG
jgi:hypothetical protein